MFQQQKKPNTFPEVKVADILQCLSYVNIKISEQQLKAPTPELVQYVYTSFVELLFSTSADELSLPGLHESGHMQSPEIYEEGIPAFEMFRKIKKLMDTIGIVNFSMNDLIHPNFKDFKHHLSAIINFARFRENKINVYQNLVKTTDELMDKKNQLQSEFEELQGELQEARAITAAHDQELFQLEKETHEQVSRLKEYNQTQADYTEETKSLSKKLHDVSERFQQQESLIQSLKNECERLESKIVHNPELYKKKLIDLQDAVQQARISLQQEDKRVHETSMQLKQVQQSSKQVGKAIKVLQECELEYNKFKEEGKKIKELQQQMEQVQDAEDELESKKKHALRQIQTMAEMSETLKNKNQDARLVFQTHLEDAKRKRKTALKMQQMHQEKAAKQMQLLGKVRQENEKMVKQHEMEMLKMLDDFAVLEKQVKEYHQRLLPYLTTV